MYSRRAFIQAGVAGLSVAGFASSLLAGGKGTKFKFSAPDWSLGQECKLDAVGLSKKIGFSGVQISIGHATQGQTLTSLPLSDKNLQQQYLSAAKKAGIPLTSLCLEIMHQNGLKSDPLGEKWLAESIPIAKALGLKVILVPFFGKWAIKQRSEQERVGDILRNIAPQAEKLGVILGLEDTISARENVAIMERSKSSAVMTYYDVGNSTGEGFDVVEEIKWLGRERICEVHFKENPWNLFMGQGKINFAKVVDTLADIGYDKWVQLETSCPTKNVESDFAKNLKFVQELALRRNQKGSAA